MPIALGLSLALNLAVAAAVGGAMWRFHEGGGPHGRPLRGEAPYLSALGREDRREIRRAIRQAPGDRRAQMQEMFSLLRAEPFDPAPVRALLERQRESLLQRQDLTSAAWLARISRMSDDERRAYVQRLEEMMELRANRRKIDDR
ncbi:periplasmic heavy metal sensor [Sulfitobacter sp. HNIBRBA3233]|uniref:periplasmic heavy metal sensor n=1 Tax=Sulfitobacter marinivivus TaxID=3158558 RepID=UPI0032E0514C